MPNDLATLLEIEGKLVDLLNSSGFVRVSDIIDIGHHVKYAYLCYANEWMTALDFPQVCRDQFLDGYLRKDQYHDFYNFLASHL